MKILRRHWFPVALLLIAIVLVLREAGSSSAQDERGQTPSAQDDRVQVFGRKQANENPNEVKQWMAPDINSLENDARGDMIRYGKNLITQTAKYFGPHGSVARITNAMNCQNCHLDAGTRPFANCLSAVAANYPIFRERSGRIESIEFRINDCLQRSLNGKTIDSSSKEMQAMVAYLRWLGKDVTPHTRPIGAGAEDLNWMQRAANPENGQQVYQLRCSSCHGAAGQGLAFADSSGYVYPPLWGPGSYTTAAGLYRISKLAAYIKPNMPFGTASHAMPQLSNEEAWDVAAFINSQPRPQKTFTQDWPNLAAKPPDFPFGPFADSFPAQQHKFGPFGPIKEKKQQPAHGK